jgi:dipeptidyl-peptidase 4
MTYRLVFRAALLAGAMPMLLASAPVMANGPAAPSDAAPAVAEDNVRNPAVVIIEEPMPAQISLTLQAVFGSPSLNGRAPMGLKLSPDGTLVTSLRPRADEGNRMDLWAMDTATGEEFMLVDSKKVGSGAALSEEEKMQRERARIGGLSGIVTYEWTPDGQNILVPLDGDLYLANRSGNVTRLTNSEEGELNPAISPKGGYLSFVRDGAVYVGGINAPFDVSTEAMSSIQMATLPPYAEPITPPETSDTVSWGTAEFVAQEEMDRLTGYWWSPDDAYIAVQRTDEAPVGIVTRAAIGADGTTVYNQRYPAAGTPNALVELYVMKPDGSASVQVDLGSDVDIYLARVHWAGDGKTLYVQRQSRDQKTLDLLAVDPATGASNIVFTEKAWKEQSWLNLSKDFRTLDANGDGGRILWWSERDGFGHLYTYKSGKFTQLTKGPWVVHGVVGVDQKQGVVYFTGNRETPIEKQLYRVSLKGGKVEQLTENGFWNEAVMDGAASRIIVTRSNVNQPPQTYLADADGTRIRWIEENRLDGAHPYAPYLAKHQPTTFGTIKAADGQTLHYYMIRPQEDSSGAKRPVWSQHYGGPGVQRVTNQWKGALPQFLADQGYIFFELDNRGMTGRGKAFEDPIYHAMGGVEVADQLAGVEFVKTLPDVDPDKIVTYGWSYGGFLTLRLLEDAPGVFAAGVSGAPVTDWTLYDTHYTERYLGDPNAVDVHYFRSGALENSGEIVDPLLIIHGMADDNVVLDNATKIIAKMQANGQVFEMALYPGKAHGLSGAMAHSYKMTLQFFDRALDAVDEKREAAKREEN